MNRRFLFALLAAAAFTFQVIAATSHDSILRQKLADAKSATDSISLLYQIFDSSPNDNRPAVIEELYDIASRSGDDDVILDVIRLGANLSNVDHNTRLLYQQRVEQLKESDIRNSTLLFVKIRTLANELDSLPQQTFNNNQHRLLAQYNDSKNYGTLDRIEHLFSICFYLGRSTRGELLIKYMRELQELIDALPTHDIYLRSLFYVYAVDLYLANGLDDIAAQANRTMLNIINHIEKQYEVQGRAPHRHDKARYKCHVRLLASYNQLDADQAEKYYRGIEEIAARLPEVLLDPVTYERAKAYYLMSQKKYSEAMPLLIKQAQMTGLPLYKRKRMSDALIEAATGLGDNAHLSTAYDINNKILKQTIASKADDSYDALQIIYDVDNLRQENSDLEIAHKQLIVKRHNDRIKYSAISLLVLLSLLVAVYILYTRSKRLSKRIAASNRRLTNERDNLRHTRDNLEKAREKAKQVSQIKSDFINNMSHEIRTPLTAISEYSALIAECAHDDKKQYIKRFANIITLNADLLLTIVNEVLANPNLDNARSSVKVTQAEFGQICDDAIEKIKPKLKPEVVLIADYDDVRQLSIKTDPHLIGTVLSILLKNAAKYTDNGSITLSCHKYDETIEFAVTDTGTGISPEQADSIISQFKHLDIEAKGKGYGLYIGRLIASLLKGKLYLDTGYTKGARFVFSIPTNSNSK